MTDSLTIAACSRRRFWEDVRNLIFDLDRIENAPKECEEIDKIVDLTPSSRILDVGCGVGRHSIAFAQMGYEVVGVDMISYHIEEARNVTRRMGLPVSFIHGDIADLPVKEDVGFDLACNLYRSLGYEDALEHDYKVLRKIHSMLSGGGWLILELIDPDDFYGNEVRTSEAVVSGTVFKEKITVDTCVENYELTITKVDEPDIIYTATHRLFSWQKIREMLEHCGFSVERLERQSLIFKPKGSRKIVVIATKT